MKLNFAGIAIILGFFGGQGMGACVLTRSQLLSRCFEWDVYGAGLVAGLIFVDYLMFSSHEV